jgi:N-acetylglucosamine-6-sulfatase
MNRYAGTTYKPPGWDRWFAVSTSGEPQYFGYDVVRENNTIAHYGTNEGNYMTDVLSSEAGTFIRNSAPQVQPFFAYIAPIAPHTPATPAPRDEHTFDDVMGPRLSSFDEGNVFDKPSWIRQLPRLTAARVSEIDNRHERRVESLQAVDDLVQNVVGALNNAGELEDTYIFFTSDNGFHQGEHRILAQKWRPYEEDVNVPLLVRGPDVAPGSTTYKLALNTDYLPTFMRLAGAQPPPYVDGRSLRPVLRGTVTSWRSAVVLEAAAAYSPSYRGVRTTSTDGVHKRKYVAYTGGEKELYDLGSAPRELVNNYSSSSSVAT